MHGHSLVPAVQTAYFQAVPGLYYTFSEALDGRLTAQGRQRDCSEHRPRCKSPTHTHTTVVPTAQSTALSVRGASSRVERSAISK